MAGQVCASPYSRMPIHTTIKRLILQCCQLPADHRRLYVKRSLLFTYLKSPCYSLSTTNNRNFPTDDNIKKKEEELQQKIARGEVATTESFRCV